MKKITLLLIVGFSIILFSCNNKLKDSEAFIGTYITNGTITGDIDYSYDTITAVDQDFADIFTDEEFSIRLGDYDDEVIVYNFYEDLEILAIVTNNRLEIIDTIIRFPLIIENTQFPISIPLTVSGNGVLTDNNIEFTIDANGGMEFLNLSFNCNALVKGSAVKN